MMLKVLLCEDDEGQLFWLQTKLTGEGFDVVATTGGDECFATWKGRRPFDFLISDFSFVPGKQIRHGLDLVRAVHDIDPNQRIIIQTGNTGLIVPPGVRLLTKPYSFHRLLRTMKRMQAMKPLPLFEAR